LVKNLSKNITAREFYLMMRNFGDIKLCKLVVDYYGASKGYGYVYYYESSSAETAMNQLQNKLVEQKNLAICTLIPGKTRDNFRNNIYIKNLPVTFTEEDLKKMFEKYGEIKSAIISRDIEGNSRGFGFVCFTNPGIANQAYRETKEQNLQFSGLEPLYLNYAQKKDDRIEMLMKDSAKLEQLTVFARLRDDMYLIKSSEDFEKEIKDLLKLLLTNDYIPKEIKIKMESKTALVTMNSQADMEFLMSKYVEYCNYYLPRIFLNYYQNKNERSQTHTFINQLNSFINPVNMFSNFKNLSIVDPNIKPVINVDPNKPFPNKNSFSKNQNYNNKQKYYHSKQRRYNNNYNNQNYNRNYKNYQGAGQVDKNTNGVNNISDNKSNLVDLDEKESAVSTPLYDRESQDELSSLIYDAVVRKYPQ
jgi:RNA recognition motif-containing protein